jgi:hypothetical protein
VLASDQKGSKLQEASQQQQYNRAVEDIELWLSEVEGQLLSEDYGKVLHLYLTIFTYAGAVTDYVYAFIYMSESTNRKKSKSQWSNITRFCSICSIDDW